LIEWAEQAATARSIGVVRDNDVDDSILSYGRIRKWAGFVAAAYYDATYSPQLRWRERDQKMVLFSFPWLVVGDVIASVFWSIPRTIKASRGVSEQKHPSVPWYIQDDDLIGILLKLHVLH
jgi:hypothetical protein